MTARLYGLATGVPDHTASQRHLRRFMKQVAQARVDDSQRTGALEFLDAIYDGCGIERRHSVIEDFTRDEPEAFSFFPRNWRLEPFPSTHRRMQAYESEAIELAETTARAALNDAGVGADRITHLVYVTCTGLFAPGPDVLLVERLGLPRSVRRQLVGFMGCYGAFNGLRLADQIIGANPDAVVLQVCVELCSLHFQVDPGLETMVSNCLFADGAAAAVFAGADRFDRGLADIETTHSHLAADSLGQMRWTIEDTGFRMGLDPEVPSTIRRGSSGFVRALLDRGTLHPEDVGAWLIHPGGPRILDATRDGCNLDESDMALSRGVLRDFGNMSSPTVLFALRRHLDANPRCRPMVMLGFGPGLTMEGAVLTPANTRR